LILPPQQSFALASKAFCFVVASPTLPHLSSSAIPYSCFPSPSGRFCSPAFCPPCLGERATMSALTPLLRRTSGVSVPRPAVSEPRLDPGLAPFGSWKEGCRPPRLRSPDRDSRHLWNGELRSLWIS